MLLQGKATLFFLGDFSDKIAALCKGVLAQNGARLPFLTPEMDFLLFVFTEQFSERLQRMFCSLNIIHSAPFTKVLEIIAQLPQLLKNINVERLKILKPAATYGWKAVRAENHRGGHGWLK